MISCLNPESISPPFARYSHGVSISDNYTWVVTSGQLALDADNSIPQGAQAQAALCFKNIDAILREAGATVDNVVKINAFVTDRIHMTGYMEARDTWLTGVNHLPASTLIIVNGFTRPEFLVEIEAIAAIR